MFCVEHCSVFSNLYHHSLFIRGNNTKDKHLLMQYMDSCCLHANAYYNKSAMKTQMCECTSYQWALSQSFIKLQSVRNALGGGRADMMQLSYLSFRQSLKGNKQDHKHTLFLGRCVTSDSCPCFLTDWLLDFSKFIWKLSCWSVGSCLFVLAEVY